MENQPTAIELREQEVAQYEANIAMYTAILAGLPSEWPEHLVKYRNVQNKHEAAAEVEDLDDVTLLSQLWYADQCHASIRSETVEKTKAAAILAALQA